MIGIALVGSKCSGTYLTSTGDGDKWLPVTGEITTGSKKVFNNSRAVAHEGSEVIMQTGNGPKKMKVAEGSDYTKCELGAIAYLGCKVTGDRFKDGEIIGDCSREVTVP